MDIFIRRLPQSVTRLDLIHFIADALRPQWGIFKSKREHTQIDCEILQLTDTDTLVSEYHGIAHFDDPTQALAVVARLNGQHLKGKRMEVRKYFHRSELRDRRKRANGRPLPDDVVEKRRTDRRRGQLSMTSLHAGATRPQFYGQRPHA